MSEYTKSKMILREENTKKVKIKEGKGEEDEDAKCRTPLLTDLIRGDFIKRLSFGNVFKYSNTKNNLYYSVIEVLGANNSILKKISEYSQLSPHQSIVQCFGSTMENDTIYIFMEHIEGKSLKDFLSNHGPLDYKSIVRFTMQILEGLNFLHENNITPKDITCSNIFMDGLDKVKVDCSYLYEEGESGIVSNYLSNSKDCSYSESDEHSFSTNISSLGSIVAHMLTGKQIPSKIEMDDAIVKSLLYSGFKDFLSEAFKINLENCEQVNIFLKSNFFPFHPKIIYKETPIDQNVQQEFTEDLDTYMQNYKENIGMRIIDTSDPKSKTEWEKYIERKIRPNILSKQRLEIIYNILKEMIKISLKKKKDKRNSNENNMKNFMDFSILCIHTKLFETRSEKDFLFNNEKSFNFFRSLISDRFELLKDNSKPFSYLKEWINFMESFVDFLEDILKEYLDNISSEDNDLAEDAIEIYMVILKIKENYDKMKIFTKMDYTMILKMSKSKRLIDNIRSSVIYKFKNIYDYKNSIKILNDMSRNSLSEDQKVAINCLLVTLKRSLGIEYTSQKDKILKYMLKWLEYIYPHLFENIAAVRMAETIFYEVCEYKIYLNTEIKKKVRNICNKYISTPNITEEIELTSSVILCFTTFNDGSLSRISVMSKLNKISERMKNENLETYLGFTCEEIEGAISEGEKIPSYPYRGAKASSDSLTDAETNTNKLFRCILM